MVIDHALDSATMRKIPLRNPYVIKVRQEAVLQLYGLKFQSVSTTAQAAEILNERTSYLTLYLPVMMEVAGSPTTQFRANLDIECSYLSSYRKLSIILLVN